MVKTLNSEIKVLLALTEIEKKHKIILFGRIYRGLEKDEETLYQFLHQRSDGIVLFEEQK